MCHICSTRVGCGGRWVKKQSLRSVHERLVVHQEGVGPALRIGPLECGYRGIGEVLDEYLNLDIADIVLLNQGSYGIDQTLALVVRGHQGEYRANVLRFPRRWSIRSRIGLNPNERQ